MFCGAPTSLSVSMKCNKDEAARVKALAEKKMLDKDFVGAKRMIIKAQQLSKELDDIDISKMLTVCDVHCAAGATVNAEIDWYGILQVPIDADGALIKKQYRKLAFLLHPDKNKFGGAEAAFKLVGGANITLTDQSKRYVYNMKRNAYRLGGGRSPCQQSRKPGPTRFSATPYQHQQHQASNTFWTICPSCGMRYQYYLSILKKALRCQNCLKPFIAHDLKEQAVPFGANQRSAGPEVTGQKPWSSTPEANVNIGSPRADVYTKRETCRNTSDRKHKRKSEQATGNPSKASSTSGLKRGRRAVVESSESSISERSSDSEEEILKQSPAANNAGLGLNNDDDDASNDNKFTFADPEFFDFDQLRDVDKFRGNQIWAVYDDQGCMPRFYARITKVETTPKFMLHLVWLEFDPTNNAEVAWSDGGLPVACGRFEHGKSETTKETCMFSRAISFEKSKTRNSYEIYPRKGEVWALFKGWDIGWSSDAENHKNWNYQYEVVQVLSDLSTSTSIIVMPLVKIKGYVSLFMQSRETAPCVIPLGETLRFSHCVPHHLMRGTEREGIPEGSLELDPAALPNNLEEAFPSVIPEQRSSVRSQEGDAKCAGSSSGNSSRKGSMNVGDRQHATCMNAGIAAQTLRVENNKHNTSTAEITDVDDDNICVTEYVSVEIEFYDFSEIRLLQKVFPGQIWALYSDLDKFPNYYAFIQEVDLKNDKVQVRRLYVCPQGAEELRLCQERAIACGNFWLSSFDEMTYTGTAAFSHPVEARFTGKNGECEIIPRLGEIWAVYKNWRAGWTVQDLKKCEYELVEILGHNGSSIQVQLLRKVDGYKQVFMPYRAVGSVKTITKDKYAKFSHQIPCFRLTHQKGGKLRGYVELDPFSLPKKFLITDSA